MRVIPRKISRPAAVWLVGYALLLAAWIGGNPPGAGPDEPAHHIKAVAAAHGKLVGQSVPPDPMHSARQRRFLEKVLQAFPVPTDVSANSLWGCNAFRPVSASCLNAPLPAYPGDPPVILQATAVGPYIPAP